MPIPMIGLSGYSGSGKTTLLEKLIPALRERGIRVATIKHDAHGLSFDGSGKDSQRFSAAGAVASVVCGPRQTAVFYSCPMELAQAAALITDADLILVEGYRHGDIPQLGIERLAAGAELPKAPEAYIALVTDTPEAHPGCRCFGFEDIAAIADFLKTRL